MPGARDGNPRAAYTDRMKKLYALLAAFAAVAGWVQACYWRERADWASPADISQMLADAIGDVINEPDPQEHDDECDAKLAYGYASVHVARAAHPPAADFPWYAVMADTRFDVDEVTGLRVIDSRDGWFPSKQAAHEGIVDWSLTGPRIDGEPDF